MRINNIYILVIFQRDKNCFTHLIVKTEPNDEIFHGWLRRTKRTQKDWISAAKVPGQIDDNNWAKGLVMPADFQVRRDGAIYYTSLFDKMFKLSTGSLRRIIAPHP